ncbi:hypothetical protein T440DRAFT_60379 [Plenodomus tracheiphilus IPT5]|uniref:Uncharacterized protein n=1 Tax=Plenodomus tracheiphilus IPT5 TaxID=1408161 RepID=A0A6A7AP12_9PLEO|nr:hypothetical protein T440DRAFT_60379 [Plenodomus tracheiphilus IPT5]
MSNQDAVPTASSNAHEDILKELRSTIQEIRDAPYDAHFLAKVERVVSEFSVELQVRGKFENAARLLKGPVQERPLRWKRRAVTCVEFTWTTEDRRNKRRLRLRNLNRNSLKFCGLAFCVNDLVEMPYQNFEKILSSIETFVEAEQLEPYLAKIGEPKAKASPVYTNHINLPAFQVQPQNPASDPWKNQQSRKRKLDDDVADEARKRPGRTRSETPSRPDMTPQALHELDVRLCEASYVSYNTMPRENMQRSNEPYRTGVTTCDKFLAEGSKPDTGALALTTCLAIYVPSSVADGFVISRISHSSIVAIRGSVKDQQMGAGPLPSSDTPGAPHSDMATKALLWLDTQLRDAGYMPFNFEDRTTIYMSTSEEDGFAITGMEYVEIWAKATCLMLG